MTEHRLLRILIANERKDRLERIAEIVTGLGHTVISRELEVADVHRRPSASTRTWRLSGSASAESTPST